MVTQHTVKLFYSLCVTFQITHSVTDASILPLHTSYCCRKNILITVL